MDQNKGQADRGGITEITCLEAPVFLRRLDELNASSDRVWLLALTTGLVFTLTAAFIFPFSLTGKFLVYATLFIRAGLFLWAGEALQGRGGETLSVLFRLGLVAGIFELLVDWGLIHWVSRGRLVYLTGNDVVLLGSPVWMPLAWACVITELGYPAVRLYGLMKKYTRSLRAAVIASLVTGAAAAVTVGFYEFFAYRAGWWRYERANQMIGDYCALYIPLGEFIMFLAILPITARALSAEDRTMAPGMEGGALFAAAIALGYAFAYLLLES
jgi:hypothetical protein